MAAAAAFLHTHLHFQINGFNDRLHKKKIIVWMLALRWTEINRFYWLQVIGEEAVGFNKRHALANQCTSIYRRDNMTSLFSEWWPRTAHTAIIHRPLPSPFLPLPFPYVLRFFFKFLNIHFFCLSLLPLHYSSLYTYPSLLSFTASNIYSPRLHTHFTKSALPLSSSSVVFPQCSVSMRLLHSHHSHYSQSTFAVLL